MYLQITKKYEQTVVAKSGAMKAWRKAPGDFTLACHAAHHVARRDQLRIVLVHGNSYGHKVFHMATELDRIGRFIFGTECNVAVVDPAGNIFAANASDKASA